VSHIPAKIATARHCIHQNQLFFKQLLDAMTDAGGAPEPLCYSNEAADAWAAAHGQAISPGDAEKVRYVLKNLMRDWSEEGHGERDESYGAIIAALRDVFSTQLEAASRDGDDATMLVSPPRVLVPGCGLARLCVELAGHGFETLGNEHSYFMLLASGFVLNHTSRARQVRVLEFSSELSFVSGVLVVMFAGF
jgi:carnosine N-methyltransferase